tara:strand:- start:553 stop:900 length:348 start_codon:yes stop_codon:yes gene_type:complete
MKLFEITSIEGNCESKMTICGYYEGGNVKFKSIIHMITKENAMRERSDESSIIIKGSFYEGSHWYKIETTLDNLFDHIKPLNILNMFEEPIFEYSAYQMPMPVYIAFIGSVVTVL